jgi:hypothetical protein
VKPLRVRPRTIAVVPETELSAAVRLVLMRASAPLPTSEVVEALKGRFDGHAVVDALECWREVGQVLQDADGEWEWLGL